MSRFDQTVTFADEQITLTNETRFVGPIAVSRYRIITTDTWVYEAREPATTHTSVTTIEHAAGTKTCRCADGVRRYDTFGAMGSQDLPPEIGAMPRGEARYAACKAWRAREAGRAHAAILSAFPEAAYGARRSDGEIELDVGRSATVYSAAS